MHTATAATPGSVSAWSRYALAGRRAGVPRDQLENFIRAEIFLQPRQLLASAAARECDREDGPEEIGYGGARGGGKSHWLLSQIGADDCQRRPGVKALLLRKVGRANQENFEDLRQRCLMRLPHTYAQQRGILTFQNGSFIVLGHFQNEKDIDQYLGLEYDVIGVEEATTLTAKKYQSITTCSRTSKPGWRPRLYSTTNPGGVGHAWYKARFIDPQRRGREHDTRFIPATVDDNRFLDPGYAGKLDKLTGWELRAWKHGDWDIAAGQFFTTWREKTHVIPSRETPAGWRKWLALDYGFTHYTSVHLLEESDDGDLYVTDEHCERGWLPSRHVPAIQAMLKRHKLSVPLLWKTVAGQDVFAKGKDAEGRTIAETYKDLGLPLEPANWDRISGASEILSRLGDADSVPPVRPRLFIMDRCRRLIECLPEMQHDPHRPEDVLKVDCDEDGNGGDDAYDSLRYGVMAAWGRKASYAVAGQRANLTPPGIAVGTPYPMVR